MTIQPDYVKEELLHELSESFCMHNQLPPDLFTRYRIKRGLLHGVPPELSTFFLYSQSIILNFRLFVK